jgi:PhzF family phenazine biosynthesis protein
MKKFRFKKIDAFATKMSSGNPAGYIWLNSKLDISNDQMQQIAKELKGFVSEVGFVFQTSIDSFDLRFYSSEREVDFCGHATIAIMYDLVSNSRELQQFELLHIVTNRGKLVVENRLTTEDSVFIMSPEPFEKHKIPNIQVIADKLTIRTDEIDVTKPVSIVNAGLSTLIVPIKTLNSTLEIAPNFKELKEFCLTSDIDIIEVFTTDIADKKNNYRTRVFAPTFGYLEDPATGSGNSAFVYYLLKNDMWVGTTLTIEQNGLRDRFNIVKLQKKVDKNGSEKVFFGGAGITRINGEYILH